ncbi:4-phosphoerythronate dehydrogenase PdxB [candidate division NPL-UPA2 bacterium]|nr:4-phosphoerythronate dehydrogenase PdxB [candidate division NPL-UPA2 bacterium]
MKIVADENIPFVEEAFGRLGEVVTLPGRQIDASAVKEADILLVRTVTQVDEYLLEGSRVRFVATATIGLDHVDLDYLKKKGFGFASAAGCNANSVAEYIVAALLILARWHQFSLSEKTIGVVGVGNVGSRVVEKAGILGMNVLQNDPPRARKTGEARFRPLEELLQESDILTLHVPLTYKGSDTLTGTSKSDTYRLPEDATYHMANEALFEKMKKGSFFINTSRGAVVDSPSLLKALKTKRLSGAVLDVWEGEPEISEELLRAADLGTPHIAGYSREGKANATLFIYQATCRFLNVSPDWQPSNLPPPPHPEIEVHGERGEGDEAILSEVVRKAYDLEWDDRTLRRILKIPLSERGAYFDRLRNEYPVRREFHSVKVKLAQSNEKVSNILRALGFKIKQVVTDDSQGKTS